MDTSRLRRHIKCLTYCKEEFERIAVKLINGPVHREGLLEALQCSDALKSIILFLKLVEAMSLNVKEGDIIQIVVDAVCWVVYLRNYTLNS